MAEANSVFQHSSEIHDICNDVTLLYNADDDEQSRIERIHQLESQMAEVMTKAQANTKTYIKELSKGIEDQTTLRDNSSAITINGEDIESVAKAKEAVTQQMRQVEADEQSIMQVLENVNSSRNKAEKAKSDIESQKNTDIPRTRYAVSLFANITGIKWSEESTLSKCGGYIACLGSGKVQKFNLDRDAMDDYQAAEELWSMIGAPKAAQVM